MCEEWRGGKEIVCWDLRVKTFGNAAIRSLSLITAAVRHKMEIALPNPIISKDNGGSCREG